MFFLVFSHLVPSALVACACVNAKIALAVGKELGPLFYFIHLWVSLFVVGRLPFSGPRRRGISQMGNRKIIYSLSLCLSLSLSLSLSVSKASGENELVFKFGSDGRSWEDRPTGAVLGVCFNSLLSCHRGAFICEVHEIR